MRQFFVFCFLILFSLKSFSQANDSLTVNVYMHCSFCDQTYIRNELKIVQYVRDLSDANVIVVGVDEETGSGGSRYRLMLEGKKEFNGINDTIIFETSNDATEDEIRKEYVKQLKLALLPYIIKTPLRAKIEYSIPDNNSTEVTLPNDPWKGWVFSIRSSGWFNGEESNKSYNANSSIEINKVQESWKFIFSVNQNYSKSIFSYDEYLYEYVNSSNNARLSSIWSLSNHWSAGIFFSGGSSTYNNYKLYTTIAPGVEYSVFPYDKSFERKLFFTYKIGTSYNQYKDTTIFNKLKETLLSQNLQISFSIFKKWGNINFNLYGNQYFHDSELFSLGTYTGLSVRIVKGLSVYFYGGYSMIRNQINLAKQDISQEELLLRQRQMKTNYSYWGNVGFSYTFGSKFNNVVNPRFEE